MKCINIKVGGETYQLKSENEQKLKEELKRFQLSFKEYLLNNAAQYKPTEGKLFKGNAEINDIVFTNTNLQFLDKPVEQPKIESNKKQMLDKLFQNNILTEIDGKNWYFDEDGRIFVFGNIDGKIVPFYRSSSGTSNKELGKWYPVLGFGSKGWIVKGLIDSKEDKYNPDKGYGNSNIKSLQDFLNNNIDLKEIGEFGDKLPNEIFNIFDKNKQLIVSGNIELNSKIGLQPLSDEYKKSKGVTNKAPFPFGASETKNKLELTRNESIDYTLQRLNPIKTNINTILNKLDKPVEVKQEQIVANQQVKVNGKFNEQFDGKSIPFSGGGTETGTPADIAMRKVADSVIVELAETNINKGKVTSSETSLREMKLKNEPGTGGMGVLKELVLSPTRIPNGHSLQYISNSPKVVMLARNNELNKTNKELGELTKQQIDTIAKQGFSKKEFIDNLTTLVEVLKSTDVVDYISYVKDMKEIVEAYSEELKLLNKSNVDVHNLNTAGDLAEEIQNYIRRLKLPSNVKSIQELESFIESLGEIEASIFEKNVSDFAANLENLDESWQKTIKKELKRLEGDEEAVSLYMFNLYFLFNSHVFEESQPVKFVVGNSYIDKPFIDYLMQKGYDFEIYGMAGKDRITPDYIQQTNQTQNLTQQKNLIINKEFIEKNLLSKKTQTEANNWFKYELPLLLDSNIINKENVERAKLLLKLIEENKILDSKNGELTREMSDILNYEGNYLLNIINLQTGILSKLLINNKLISDGNDLSKTLTFLENLPTQSSVEFNKIKSRFVGNLLSPEYNKLINSIQTKEETVKLLKEFIDKYSNQTQQLNSEAIYNQLGNKTKSENVVIVPNPNSYLSEQDKGNAVVAYRGGKKDANFGNPFTDGDTKSQVVRFIDFVLNSNEPQAQWIRNEIKSGKYKGKPIYYGNTAANKANVNSHATALDYLINKYDWNQTQTTQKIATNPKWKQDAIQYLPNGNVLITGYRTDNVEGMSGFGQRGKGLYLSLDRPIEGTGYSTMQIELNPKQISQTLYPEYGTYIKGAVFIRDVVEGRVILNEGERESLHLNKGIKAAIGLIESPFNELGRELVIYDPETINKAIASKKPLTEEQALQELKDYKNRNETQTTQQANKEAIEKQYMEELYNYDMSFPDGELIWQGIETESGVEKTEEYLNGLKAIKDKYEKLLNEQPTITIVNNTKVDESAEEIVKANINPSVTIIEEENKAIDKSELTIKPTDVEQSKTLEQFVKELENSSLKPLLQRFLESNKETVIKYAKLPNEIDGQYSLTEPNVIYVNVNKQDNAGVVLHELIHRFSVNQFFTNEAIAKEFNDLFDKFEKHVESNKKYKNQLSDNYKQYYENRNNDRNKAVLEFIAYGMSDMSMIDMLSKIKTETSLYEDFIDIIVNAINTFFSVDIRKGSNLYKDLITTFNKSIGEVDESYEGNYKDIVLDLQNSPETSKYDKSFSFITKRVSNELNSQIQQIRTAIGDFNSKEQEQYLRYAVGFTRTVNSDVKGFEQQVQGLQQGDLVKVPMWVKENGAWKQLLDENGNPKTRFEIVVKNYGNMITTSDLEGKKRTRIVNYKGQLQILGYKKKTDEFKNIDYKSIYDEVNPTRAGDKNYLQGVKGISYDNDTIPSKAIVTYTINSGGIEGSVRDYTAVVVGNYEGMLQVVYKNKDKYVTTFIRPEQIKNIYFNTKIFSSQIENYVDDLNLTNKSASYKVKMGDAFYELDNKSLLYRFDKATSKFEELQGKDYEEKINELKGYVKKDDLVVIKTKIDNKEVSYSAIVLNSSNKGILVKSIKEGSQIQYISYNDTNKKLVRYIEQPLQQVEVRETYKQLREAVAYNTDKYSYANLERVWDITRLDTDYKFLNEKTAKFKPQMLGKLSSGDIVMIESKNGKYWNPVFKVEEGKVYTIKEFKNEKNNQMEYRVSEVNTNDIVGFGYKLDRKAVKDEDKDMILNYLPLLKTNVNKNTMNWTNVTNRMNNAKFVDNTVVRGNSKYGFKQLFRLSHFDIAKATTNKTTFSKDGEILNNITNAEKFLLAKGDIVIYKYEKDGKTDYAKALVLGNNGNKLRVVTNVDLNGKQVDFNEMSEEDIVNNIDKFTYDKHIYFKDYKDVVAGYYANYRHNDNFIEAVKAAISQKKQATFNMNNSNYDNVVIAKQLGVTESLDNYSVANVLASKYQMNMIDFQSAVENGEIDVYTELSRTFNQSFENTPLPLLLNMTVNRFKKPENKWFSNLIDNNTIPALDLEFETNGELYDYLAKRGVNSDSKLQEFITNEKLKESFKPLFDNGLLTYYCK